MKKRIFSSLFMMAALAMVAMTIAACGGDDDDNNGVDNKIGVHRIDIHYDNAEECEVMTGFYGIKADGNTSQLYEGGKQLPTDEANTWTSEELRDYSVSTEENSASLNVAISVSSPNLVPIDKDITVTIVSYINNKRVSTQVFTLPAGHKVLTASWSTISTDPGSGYVI